MFQGQLSSVSPTIAKWGKGKGRNSVIRANPIFLLLVCVTPYAIPQRHAPLWKAFYLPTCSQQCREEDAWGIPHGGSSVLNFLSCWPVSEGQEIYLLLPTSPTGSLQILKSWSSGTYQASAHFFPGIEMPKQNSPVWDLFVTFTGECLLMNYSVHKKREIGTGTQCLFYTCLDFISECFLLVTATKL